MKLWGFETFSVCTRVPKPSWTDPTLWVTQLSSSWTYLPITCRVPQFFMELDILYSVPVMVRRGAPAKLDPMLRMLQFTGSWTYSTHDLWSAPVLGCTGHTPHIRMPQRSEAGHILLNAPAWMVSWTYSIRCWIPKDIWRYSEPVMVWQGAPAKLDIPYA